MVECLCLESTKPARLVADTVLENYRRRRHHRRSSSKSPGKVEPRGHGSVPRLCPKFEWVKNLGMSQTNLLNLERCVWSKFENMDTVSETPLSMEWVWDGFFGLCW
jgi:hypothetical protein